MLFDVLIDFLLSFFLKPPRFLIGVLGICIISFVIFIMFNNTCEYGPIFRYNKNDSMGNDQLKVHTGKDRSFDTHFTWETKYLEYKLPYTFWMFVPSISKYNKSLASFKLLRFDEFKVVFSDGVTKNLLEKFPHEYKILPKEGRSDRVEADDVIDRHLNYRVIYRGVLIDHDDNEHPFYRQSAFKAVHLQKGEQCYTLLDALMSV